MGSGRSRGRYEPYTSFDILPTEYFNRRQERGSLSPSQGSLPSQFTQQFSQQYSQVCPQPCMQPFTPLFQLQQCMPTVPSMPVQTVIQPIIQPVIQQQSSMGCGQSVLYPQANICRPQFGFRPHAKGPSHHSASNKMLMNSSAQQQSVPKFNQTASATKF